MLGDRRLLNAAVADAVAAIVNAQLDACAAAPPALLDSLLLA